MRIQLKEHHVERVEKLRDIINIQIKAYKRKGKQVEGAARMVGGMAVAVQK